MKVGGIMEDLEGFLMEDEATLIDKGPDFEGSQLNSSTLDGWLDIELPEVDVIGILPDNPEDNDGSVNLDYSFLSDQSNTSFEEQIVYQENPGFRGEEPREEKDQEGLFQCEEADTLFEDEEDEVASDDRKSSFSSKNVVSERNRRKRLNQQLFTLRSLVPNITKMDKRSILVDALAYLQSILQQTETEMKMFEFDDNLNSSEEDSAVVIDLSPPEQCRECTRPAIPTILKIDAEMLGENRFVLKVTSNKAIGALGQVQKVIESLGLQITFVSVNEVDRDHCLTMTFLQARKKGVVTEEKVKHRVKVLATKMGFQIWEL